MANPIFTLPPRDGMSDAEYIPCLEESIRIMGEVIIANEQRLLTADSLLRAVLCSLPDRSATLTQQAVYITQGTEVKPSTSRIVNSLQAMLDGNTPLSGICSGLHTHDKRLFAQLATKWPYYSGDLHYPVPSLKPPLSPQMAYDHLLFHGSHFDGAYGVLRTDLCAFVVCLLEDPDFDPQAWHSEAVDSVLSNVHLSKELL